MQPYYLIDSRQVVGNCVMFWRKDNAGYTCDLDDAQIYTEPRSLRETDIPISVDVAQSLVIKHVRIERIRELQASGAIPKPKPPMRATMRCAQCPRFIRRDGWLCPSCQEKGVTV